MKKDKDLKPNKIIYSKHSRKSKLEKRGINKMRRRNKKNNE
ncbi:MAG: hypothetical protein U9Q21_04445 [Candidatus Auribacterota bacterium]|nr:hypothetical protein [Candidatus Auribacterota bacterium]